MQGDHIRMSNLFQYANFALDIFPAHSTPAWFRSPFLDEFCCKLLTGAFLTAFFHYCKLPTEKKKKRKEGKNEDECSVQGSLELRVASIYYAEGKQLYLWIINSAKVHHCFLGNVE